jgi:hypothetical protein
MIVESRLSKYVGYRTPTPTRSTLILYRNIDKQAKKEKPPAPKKGRWRQMRSGGQQGNPALSLERPVLVGVGRFPVDPVRGIGSERCPARVSGHTEAEASASPVGSAEVGPDDLVGKPSHALLAPDAQLDHDRGLGALGNFPLKHESSLEPVSYLLKAKQAGSRAKGQCGLACQRGIIATVDLRRRCLCAGDGRNAQQREQRHPERCELR